jgi:hypothetical protein
LSQSLATSTTGPRPHCGAVAGRGSWPSYRPISHSTRCAHRSGEVGRRVFLFLAFGHDLLAFLDQPYHALAGLRTGRLAQHFVPLVLRWRSCAVTDFAYRPARPWASDLAISRPIAKIDRMSCSSESWQPQTAPTPCTLVPGKDPSTASEADVQCSTASLALTSRLRFPRRRANAVAKVWIAAGPSGII